MNFPLYYYIIVLFLVLWTKFYASIKHDKVLYSLGYLMMYNLAMELFAWLYSYFTKSSNHWVYNIHTTLQIVFLLYIYKQIIISPKIRKAIYFIVAAFLLIALVNCIFSQNFSRFHTYTYVTGADIIAFVCIAFFYDLLNSNNLPRLKNTPAFWFNCANLLYYPTSMLYLGSINFIIEKRLDHYGGLLNLFVYVFMSLQYILYIVSLVCILKPKMRSFSHF